MEIINGEIISNHYDLHNEAENVVYTNIITGRNVQIRSSRQHNQNIIGGQSTIKPFGPSNLIKKIVNTPSEIRLYIRPPNANSLNTYVTPYLQNNKHTLLTQIKALKLVNNNTSYKIYITCFSKYYKHNNQNQVEFGGVHNQCRNFYIPAASNAINHDYLQDPINDIGSLQVQNQGKMQNSNWIYFGTAQIEIIYLKMIGKSVMVKDYTPYCKVLGRDSVINIPNTNPQNQIDKISPCVVVALRCYKYQHDQTNIIDKEENMDKLCKNRGGTKNRNKKNNARITTDIWTKLRAYDVQLPISTVMTDSFTMEHWDGLENANRIPICVHILKTGQTKEKTINIECIRAPTLKTMNKYPHKAICHLLMITPFHVCYIPDINKYLKHAFRSKAPNRCCFCYIAFYKNQGLLDHLRNAACHHENNFSPTTMLLTEGEYLHHENMLNKMCPELSIICDAEAYILPDSTNVTKTDDESDSDNDLDDFNLADRNLINEKPTGHMSKHQAHSVGLISLDHEYNYLEYKQVWGTDCAEKLLDTIQGMINNYHQNLAPMKWQRPVLTNDDWKAFHNDTHCPYCNVEYITLNSKLVHRHHDHHKKPIYGQPRKLACGKLSYPVVEGNYIGSSCAQCNWKITNKRRIVNVWMHNFSHYDGPLLLGGMLKSKIHDLGEFTILPKGATGYHYVQYKNIRFVDTLSFLQGSLSKLVEKQSKKIDTSFSNTSEKIEAMSKVFPNTVKAIQNSRFKDEVIPLLTRKLVYPYSLPKHIDDFETINYFPERAAFRDDLNECDISENDYNDGKLIFDISGSKSLKDIHDLYLLTDCGFLSDVWSSYNKLTFESFGLHASNFISGPSLSFAAGLKVGKTDIELLTDESKYEIFNNSIRGGFCGTNQRHAQANNIDMDGFDPSKPSSSLMFLDWNALYSECLTQSMPFGKFKYLDDKTISDYEKNPKLFLDISPDNDKGCFITCNFDIPEQVARATDCMPLSMVNTTKITPSKYMESITSKNHSHKKLVAGHFSLEKYSFHYRLLQEYIKLGVKVTKIHSIIEFSQKPIFKEFIQQCAQARTDATLKGDLNAKLINKSHGNNLYGKTLQDALSYNTKNVLTLNDRRYQKLVSHYRFKSRRWIVKDHIAIVTMFKSKVKVKTPVFIGACILQLAKLKNLHFVHLIMQPSCLDFQTMSTVLHEPDRAIIEKSRLYIQFITIIYTDTDSLLIYIKYTDQARKCTLKHMIENTFLGQYMDCSNFANNQPSLPNPCAPSQMGYLKSEVGSNTIIESIALAAKSYSILSIEKESNEIQAKTAVKGCPSRIAKNVYNHQAFHDILYKDNYQIPSAKSNHIRRDKKTGVNTVTIVRTCLSLFENKRWWRDYNYSLGWGHPDIPSEEYKPGFVLSDRGAIIKDSIPPDQIIFQNNPVLHPNPDAQINPISDNYSEAGDLYDTDHDMSNYSDSVDLLYSNIETVTVNNDDVTVNTIEDFERCDTFFEEYDLTSDTQHEYPDNVIPFDHQLVNMNIDEQDIVCYKKKK